MLYPSVSAFLAAGLEWRWPNFTPQELACKCNGRHCQGEYYHDPDFLDSLQALRDAHGGPLRINSGRRCLLWNRANNSRDTSMHTREIAGDISIRDMGKKARYELYRKALKAGFTGIGRAATFLHVDKRKKFTSWLYEGAWVHW